MSRRIDYVLFRPGGRYPDNWQVRAYYPHMRLFSCVAKLFTSRQEAMAAYKDRGQWTDRQPGEDGSIEGGWA